MLDELAITPLHAALADLEFAAVLVLLAEQEAQPVSETLPRLRRAISAVHDARELAIELREATGRPSLHVLPGSVSPPTTAPGAA